MARLPNIEQLIPMMIQQKDYDARLYKTTLEQFRKYGVPPQLSIESRFQTPIDPEVVCQMGALRVAFIAKELQDMGVQDHFRSVRAIFQCLQYQMDATEQRMFAQALDHQVNMEYGIIMGYQSQQHENAKPTTQFHADDSVSERLANLGFNMKPPA